MLRGGLFTRYFLEDGIREMSRYRGLGAGEVQTFAAAVRGHWADVAEMPHPSEAETEADLNRSQRNKGLVSSDQC